MSGRGEEWIRRKSVLGPLDGLSKFGKRTGIEVINKTSKRGRGAYPIHLSSKGGLRGRKKRETKKLRSRRHTSLYINQKARLKNLQAEIYASLTI